MGDHWGRAYGDLEWCGIVPDHVMPWYFLASNGNDTYACGVQTGASALCFWQSDQQGVRLVLDVRCGGQDMRCTMAACERALPPETFENRLSKLTFSDGTPWHRTPGRCTPVASV